MSAGYYRVGDYYFDTAAKVVYRCKTAGDKNTSVWDQVSAGSSSNVCEAYNNAHAYNVGNIVWLDTATTVGGITIQPGTYLCIATVPANGTGNQIPQFPLPVSGTVYWRCMAFGPGLYNDCNGSTGNVYINATGPF